MDNPLQKPVCVTFPEIGPTGTFHLPLSKSLLNRQLMLAATHDQPLSDLPPDLPDDVRILAEQLQYHGPIWQAGEGGTTFRFLLAWLALRGRSGIVHASGSMRRRPIGPLVDTLRALGVQLEYMDREGYPPVRLMGKWNPDIRQISVDVSHSSQFASALLLSLPLVVDSVEVHLKGPPASRPYLTMTLKLLREGGASVRWEGHVIYLSNLKRLRPIPFNPEADWTAASYAYALVALGQPGAGLRLPGLKCSGFQGDEILHEIMSQFGVETHHKPTGIRIIKKASEQPVELTFDFNDHPDLAQTFVVLCSVLGVPGRFAGLHTLRIKETDRLAALQSELVKCGVDFYPEGTTTHEVWILRGGASPVPTPLDTYGDHRMAMALSLLSRIGPVIIRNPQVVSKSFPGYWDEMGKVGFSISSLELT